MWTPSCIPFAARQALKLRDQGRTIEADVDHQHLGAIVKAIEMLVEERETAVDEPQSFPHAIAEHEARVEHRHLGLGAWDKRPVHRNQNGIVTVVADVVLRARSHHLSPRVARRTRMSDDTCRDRLMAARVQPRPPRRKHLDATRGA